MTRDRADGTDMPAVELVRGRNALRLEVVERNGDDFNIEGNVSIGRFAAVDACTASLAELSAWRAQVATLYETLSGQATLERPRFRVSMQADGRGKVLVKGTFDSEVGWGQGERAVLHFQLPPLDQTDLPGVIAMLDAAASVPAREDEDV